MGTYNPNYKSTCSLLGGLRGASKHSFTWGLGFRVFKGLEYKP